MALRPRPTLRGRLSLVALALIAIWLVILTVALNLFVRYSLYRSIDDRLRVRAQAAAASVEVHDGNIVGLREPVVDRLDSSVWVYVGSQAINRPHAEPPLQHFADSLAGSSPGIAPGGVDDARFSVVAITAADRRIGTIVTAVNIESAERASTLTLAGSTVAAVLLLGVAYPVVRFATGRVLRPVDEMSRQAAHWSVNAPERRFGDSQQFSELDELARNLDGLMDRVSAVLRHERSMSAELSHELRTPLTRILAEADLMVRDRSLTGDAQQAVHGIANTARSMETIIATLLATSRAEHGTAQGRCSVALVVKQSVEQSGQLPRSAVAAGSAGAGVTAKVSVADDLFVGIDAHVAERIVSPIIDNAARHAHTRIEFSAARRGRNVAIDIMNDGPAIATDDREKIFEPGFRGSSADNAGGAGPGLALARRLARAADGDVRVVVLDPPTFQIMLPRG
jgi:signal transduction histidine kinase